MAVTEREIVSVVVLVLVGIFVFIKVAYDVATVIAPLLWLAGLGVGVYALARWVQTRVAHGAGATWDMVIRHVAGADTRVARLSKRERDLITAGRIPDSFESIDDLKTTLRVCGLETSNLIFGIDFTASNNESGVRTFDERSLHDLGDEPNPYQRALTAVYRTLAKFDADGQIPVFGFGDLTTEDHSVFDLYHPPSGRGRARKTRSKVRFAEDHETSLDEILGAYERALSSIKLSGPTSFEPLINAALEIVKEEGNRYHILVILTDGIPTDRARDAAAIQRASQYPLSIVAVGVGDGPFDAMEYFDDMSGRKFDNFQFVNFNDVAHIKDPGLADDAFAVRALQEVPAQYATIMHLGLGK